MDAKHIGAPTDRAQVVIDELVDACAAADTVLTALANDALPITDLREKAERQSPFIARAVSRASRYARDIAAQEDAPGDVAEVVQRLSRDALRYHPDEAPPIYRDILVLLRHLDRISPVWQRFRDDDSDTWSLHEEWPFLYGAVSDLLVWNPCDGVHVWSKGAQTPPGTHFAKPPQPPAA